MSHHAAAGRDQIGAELAHAAIRSEVFVLDRLRFGFECGDRVSRVAFENATHARERPGEIHRRRPRRFEFVQRRVERLERWPFANLVQASCFERHTPRRGNADSRRAAYDEITYRRGHVIGIAAFDVFLEQRQLALIEQFQNTIVIGDGADGVMGVTGIHLIFGP